MSYEEAIWNEGYNAGVVAGLAQNLNGVGGSKALLDVIGLWSLKLRAQALAIGQHDPSRLDAIATQLQRCLDDIAAAKQGFGSADTLREYRDRKEQP